MQRLLLWDDVMFSVLHSTFGIFPVWDVIVIFFAEYAQYVIGAYFSFLFIDPMLRRRMRWK